MPNRLMNVIREIRDVDPDLPIQTLYTLLLVAEEHPRTVYQQNLGVKLGLSQSGVSRNLWALDKWSWLKKPGLDMVRTDEDPMDRRRKVVRLTPKGQAFVKRMEAALGEHEDAK